MVIQLKLYYFHMCLDHRTTGGRDAERSEVAGSSNCSRSQCYVEGKRPGGEVRPHISQT